MTTATKKSEFFFTPFQTLDHDIMAWACAPPYSILVIWFRANPTRLDFTVVILLTTGGQALAGSHVPYVTAHSQAIGPQAHGILHIYITLKQAHLFERIWRYIDESYVDRSPSTLPIRIRRVRTSLV